MIARRRAESTPYDPGLHDPSHKVPLCRDTMRGTHRVARMAAPLPEGEAMEQAPGSR